MIELVQKLEEISFIEAAKKLANEANVNDVDTTVVRERPKREIPPPTYMTESELGHIARSCVSVTADPVVSEYLRGRKLDPDLIAHLRLGRAMRPDAIHQWARTGHRFIVPLFDVHGQVRSVIARKVEGQHPAKTLTPSGCSTKGLLFACPAGLRLLRGIEPDLRPEEKTFTIVIAEGEIDGLSWRTTTDVFAVFGVRSGSWSEEVAKRIPDGARVLIATDHDTAGDRYAERIAKTLTKRGSLEVLRWTP